MRDTYGCDPTDIVAVIGPSIGPECFEVGEEVAEEFDRAFGESVIIRRGYAKPHVDLWKSNVLSLMSEGLTEEHISVCGLCTMCHPDVFWSHRKTNGLRGVQAAIIEL